MCVYVCVWCVGRKGGREAWKTLFFSCFFVCFFHSGSINNRRLSKSSLRSRLEDSAVARVRMQQQLMASPSLKLFLDSTS